LPGDRARVWNQPVTAATDEQRRGRVWPAALAFWTLLGLLESGLAHLRSQAGPVVLSWPRALANNLPWWLLWAALTPAVFAVARLQPISGRRPLRAVAVQAACALFFSVLHLLVEGAIFYFSWSHHVMRSLREQWQLLFSVYLPLEVVTCFAIVGAWHALDFHERARAGELRSARLTLGLAEARMQALRSELNPHFLFNALNAVSGLVRRQENDAAVRMLARLGELLSATLDQKRGPQIPLREELLLLDRYLDIERVRFGDRLVIEVRHGPEADAALVPTFMLQPLVENAVRHGISRRPGRARIEVQAERAADALQLTVRDTGEGLDAPGSLREGIGLSNTRARLSELYGAAATLSLENAPGGGACVRVSLPYRRAVAHA
jgi:two-component system, LytTR family, sensor kinase